MSIRKFLHLKHFKQIHFCDTKLYRCCHSLSGQSGKNENKDGNTKHESKDSNTKLFTFNYRKFYCNFQIECQLDDTSALACTLKYAALTDQNHFMLTQVITSLQNCSSNLEFDQALSIFESLVTIQSLPNDYENILKKIYEVFIRDIDKFNNIQAIYSLFSIVRKVNDKRCTEFYCPQFLDALVDRVFKNGEKNDHVESIALAFLQAFLALKHQNKRLLVHVVEEFSHKLSNKSLQISEIIKYYEVIFEGAKLMEIDLQNTYLWEKMPAVIRPNKLSSEENGKDLLMKTLHLSVLAGQNALLKDTVMQLDQLVDFSGTQAGKILETLCFFTDSLDAYDCVLQCLFGITYKDLDKLSEKQKILIWENKESKMMIDGMENHLYDPNLLDSLINNVIENSINRRDAVKMLKKLKSLRHKQPLLEDYVLTQFLEDDIPKILSTDSKKRRDFFTFLDALVFFNRKPRQLIETLNLVDFDKLLDQFDDAQLCELVFNITFLGHINIPMIKKLFGTKFSKFSEELQWKFLKLWQRIKSHPELLSKVEISEEVDEQINSIKNTFKSEIEKFPLLQLLNQALGGNQYVKTNLKTKLFHNIDHAVCYRTGGFPIAINGNAMNFAANLCVEDLDIPKNSTLVLILYLDQKCLFKNNCSQTGHSVIDVETIRAMNNDWHVITVNSDTFETLTNNEKRMSLMNEINSRIPKSDLG